MRGFTREVLAWGAAACLTFLGCGPAYSSGFEVQGVLRDGKSIEGHVDGERVMLAVIVADRRMVRLEISTPASWSTLKTAGEVEWLPDREIYVIRGTSFTAEALRIPASLKLRDESGNRFEIVWNEVRRIVFRSLR